MREVESLTRTRAMLVTALGTEIVAALEDPSVVTEHIFRDHGTGLAGPSPG